jgi:hypothetical protein
MVISCTASQITPQRHSGTLASRFSLANSQALRGHSGKTHSGRHAETCSARHRTLNGPGQTASSIACRVATSRAGVRCSKESRASARPGQRQSVGRGRVLPRTSSRMGFVCETGSWPSHTAIMAREYKVAVIVGTHGLSGVTDRSLLQLHPNGLVEIVREEELRRAATAECGVLDQGACYSRPCSARGWPR